MADPRETLSRLGLTQTGAAKLIGVPPRTLRRWLDRPGASGYREIPETATRMLALIEHVPGVREWLTDCQNS